MPKIKTTIAITPCVFCTSPYPITHVHEAVQSRRILRTTMPNAMHNLLAIKRVLERI